MGTVAENLEKVEERIAAAAARSGRSREDIRLVAVTKTVPAERVNEAIDAGVRAIGENRVQEAREKWPLIREGVERHLIGRLQRNKAGKAVELFDMVESVDRASLAEALSRRAEAAGRVLPVLVEVNVSGEESKAGVEPDGLCELVERTAALPALRLRGLMTIGPLTEDEGAVRAAFRRFRALAEEIAADPPAGAEIRWISVGMSGDYEIAIEEGANMVRIGSAIFGERR